MTTRQQSRRAVSLVSLVVVALATLAAVPAPASAATTKACKVLKRSEIRAAFGGAVASGRKGILTPTSNQCEYEVSADGDRPLGTVIVHLTTTGGKEAFEGLQQETKGYVPLDGVSDALYGEKARVVDVLQGKALLAVQANFVITDPLPVRYYDAKTQLAGLAQLGAKRL